MNVPRCMRAFVTLNGSMLILRPCTPRRSTVLDDIDRRVSRRLTNQANRLRADGAQAPPASSPVERVVRRAGASIHGDVTRRNELREKRAPASNMARTHAL